MKNLKKHKVPVEDKPANDKIRLSLEVSADLNRTLEELADFYGGTKSEVLRKAIALVQVAKDAKENSQTLGVLDKDSHLVTRIIGV
jgi:hypothetical protein